MNRRLKLVAAPALSQSEPDSGLPRPHGGPRREPGIGPHDSPMFDGT